MECLTRVSCGRGALVWMLGVTLACGHTLAAGADETPPVAGELDEITVTAQFRQEPLQSTPIAITALGHEQLDALGLAKVTDLNAIAPNVLFGPGQGTQGPMSQILVRGVGQSDGHPGFEPGVGLVIDDVYRGVVLGSALELMDLDRVEILRGPQGTLAGKNAVGGVVKLFARKPSNVPDAYLQVGYGEFNRFEAKAAGNFTLLPERAYVRLSGMSRSSDGYLRRLDYDCVNPGSGVPTQIAVGSRCELGTLGGEDVQGARLALRVLGRQWENNFIVDTTRERSEPPAVKLLSIDNPLVPNGNRFITAPESYTTFATFTNLGFTDPPRYAGQPGAGTHPGFSLPTENPIDSYGVSNNLEWRFGERSSVNLISGYRNDAGAYSIFYGGSPYTPQLLHNTWAYEAHTEELRYSLTFGVADITVGSYYYNQHAHFGGLKLLSPGAANETLFVGNDPIPARSLSGFAHAVWRLSSRASLITGLRYTDEKKTYTFDRKNPYFQSLPSYNPVGAIDGTSGRYSGNQLDYRVGLDYRFSASLMSYAQVATGFRGGGINFRPFIAQQVKPFSPETMRAVEIGMKSEWLDERVRVNVAAFTNQYEDIIFSDTSPTLDAAGNVLAANNSTPINAGDADIYGAELELSVRPSERWRVDATASYLHFEFTRIGATGATIPGVTLDTEEPYAPERKASIGVQYEMSLGTLGALTPRIDASYQSEFFTDIVNSPQGRVDGRTLLNARLTWRSPASEWESSLSVTNLADRFYYSNKNRLAAHQHRRRHPGAAA